MLWLDFLFGLLGGLLATWTIWTLNRVLNKSRHNPTIESALGIPAPGRRKLAKRAPKANTDLIAYRKEQEEEGQNRG